MRDAERQREEQKWKLRDQKHAERFNKRVWHHQSLQELWSQPLSRQQVQEKVLGALGAFSERRDSAELKDKVQVRGLLMPQVASVSITWCLHAPGSARRFRHCKMHMRYWSCGFDC